MGVPIIEIQLVFYSRLSTSRKETVFLKLTRGGSRGGCTRRAPPLKLVKIWFVLLKIVFFHTKYPKNFRASLRSVRFFLSAPPPPNLKSWIRPYWLIIFHASVWDKSEKKKILCFRLSKIKNRFLQCCMYRMAVDIFNVNEQHYLQQRHIKNNLTTIRYWNPPLWCAAIQKKKGGQFKI